LQAVKKQSSVQITLPVYLSNPKRFVSSRKGWDGLAVALAFALTLSEHGTPEAVQATAYRLVSKVPIDKQPNMKRLARGVEIPSEKAIQCAELIIDTVCKAWHV
jgi:hypothetical protein